ncbi:phage protein [Salmonella enterica subsp. salamae]|nr:phage protein [Salmonella enterica subsp. salamae]
MIPISLSKSIPAHGEEINTLELQEPTFEQIQRLGLPVSMDLNGNFTVNAQVAIKYIPVLASIPPSSLKDLGAYDMNNLCWGIYRFFMIPPGSLTNG